jgi:hypothetical protein
MTVKPELLAQMNKASRQHFKQHLEWWLGIGGLSRVGEMFTPDMQRAYRIGGKAMLEVFGELADDPHLYYVP